MICISLNLERPCSHFFSYVSVISGSDSGPPRYECSHKGYLSETPREMLVMSNKTKNHLQQHHELEHLLEAVLIPDTPGQHALQTNWRTLHVFWSGPWLPDFNYTVCLAERQHINLICLTECNNAQTSTASSPLARPAETPRFLPCMLVDRLVYSQRADAALQIHAARLYAWVLHN